MDGIKADEKRRISGGFATVIFVNNMEGIVLSVMNGISLVEH